MESILLIGIISVICSANSWNEMEEYAPAKEDFLLTFPDLPNSIPSNGTFNRVFSNIDSQQFESCFIKWVGLLAPLNPREVIAIDGKPLGAQNPVVKTPGAHGQCLDQ